jgi:glutamine---fructose-6-phosphate transaminase (isomerizing)
MSRFVEEIGQQPDALRNLTRYYEGHGSAAVDRLAELWASRRSAHASPSRVLFTGMGSSLYATESVLPRLVRAGMDASIVEAGEWLHYGPEALPEGALFVAVSQSGESVETRTLAERWAGRASLAALTNDPHSTLARAADVAFPLVAGEEEMISTKTYTNTLGVLHLVAATLMGADRRLAFDQLGAAADAMQNAGNSDMEPLVQKAAGWLDQARSIHAVARGPSLAAAREGALVLGEGAHLSVTALPAGSFRHGPLELAGEGHMAIAFSPDGPTRPLMAGLVRDLLNAGSKVILLTDQPRPSAAPGMACFSLAGSSSEQTFSFPAAIIIERLLAAVADRRRLIPGQFRFGGKITETE